MSSAAFEEAVLNLVDAADRLPKIDNGCCAQCHAHARNPHRPNCLIGALEELRKVTGN